MTDIPTSEAARTAAREIAHDAIALHPPRQPEIIQQAIDEACAGKDAEIKRLRAVVARHKHTDECLVSAVKDRNETGHPDSAIPEMFCLTVCGRSYADRGYEAVEEAEARNDAGKPNDG